MATVEKSSTVERTTSIPKESSANDRGNSAEFNNNIQNGGHVVSTSSLQQNTLGALVSTATGPQVVSAANGGVEKDFSALQSTTKAIPPSMFSYRFASPTSNQTPYYVSSDIVLSGGMAQQTRRRIVHNEVERRRKDKINNWIFKLAQVVPQCRWGKQSKNIVLEKTVEYISQVNNQLKELCNLQQREQKLAQEVQHLKTRIGNVTKENKVLKDLLKKNNIAIPRRMVAMQDSTSVMTSLETANGSVPITTVGTKPQIASAVVTMTTSKPSQVESSVTVGASPTIVTMVAQLPITSASVAGVVSKDQSKNESVAYVAPFIIANNPVSMAASTTSVTSLVTSAIPVVTPIVQNVASNQSQQEFTLLQGNMTNSATLSNSNQGIYSQLSNNLVCSSAQLAVQTLNMPVCSSHVAPASQTGFSQHSVAAIMKAALQPGTSVSPVGVVNATPLSTPVGNNASAILNVQPAVFNTPATISSATPHAVLASTPSCLPTSNSFINQLPGTGNTAVTQVQTGSVPTFYVATAPNQSVSVTVVNPNDGSSAKAQQKESNDGRKMQGEQKNHKSTYANKPQTKPNSRNHTAKRSTQNKLPENKTSTNKRGAALLPVATDASVAKRPNNHTPQEHQINMNICQQPQQPQEEIMTLQTFNITALVPGIATQGSSSNNMSSLVSNRDECSKTTAQVSSMGTGQTTQVPRLSHSIASLAGLSQSIGQPQIPADIQQHQQVSHLGSGNLSFSAESLLASNEVILPNIPHISTTSVSESNCSLQNSLSMTPASSVHSTSTDQGHNQTFSNYSAEALIGGNEIMGESVIAQETQIQRPSRTTYSDFSAESLIGSNDLNSSLSYAIDNLISSRSDANYNSTAMVSVNPNLLHSVKSNVSYDAGANALRALAALPDLVEQKSSTPSSQSTVLFSGAIPNSTYSVVSSSNSVPMQFTLPSNNNRRLRDTTVQLPGACQTVNSSNNCPSSSASFLKHSVDSITSSFYAVSNAGSSFSSGPISTSNSNSLFQTQGSFSVEPLSVGGQLSFGSMANPFSPTRPFFNHSSTMGSFV